MVALVHEYNLSALNEKQTNVLRSLVQDLKSVKALSSRGGDTAPMRPPPLYTPLPAKYNRYFIEYTGTYLQKHVRFFFNYTYIE